MADGVLSRIPGLAGYLSGQANDQQMHMGQLQQMGALQGILAKQQAAQQEQELKGTLSRIAQQAGGDPAKMGPLLLQTGHPKLMELGKGMIPRTPNPQFVNTVDEQGNPVQKAVVPTPGMTLPSQPRQAPNTVTELEKLMMLRDRLKTEGKDVTAVENAIRKQSETARQIVPPVINVNAGGKPKPPSGFQWNATGDALEPIKGGPKDPTINLTGGRESVYVQRMMMGANQAAKDLSNVVQLPLTASTGLFGGRRQGAGLLDAGKEVLANKATGQEAQAYNAMATGFQRSLAQIESAGLMPSGSLTHQMDAVLFKEGDTNLTKMHKLAQTRQIVEAGMEVIQANPRVSPSEKEKIKSVLDSIRKSVPFTHSDLISLQALQETNPAATLKDVIGKKPKWEIVR